MDYFPQGQTKRYHTFCSLKLLGEGPTCSNTTRHAQTFRNALVCNRLARNHGLSQNSTIPVSGWWLRWSNFLLLMATSRPVARNSSSSFRAGTLKLPKLNLMTVVHFCRPIHINHCMLLKVVVWKDHVSA